MNDYINIVQNTVFTGLIGLVAPFLFPYLFKVVSKWLKKELSKQEKRILVGLVSFLISLVIVAMNFSWEGEFVEAVWSFIMYLIINFTTMRGVVQSIFELIVKNIPSLDEKMDKIEKNI